jgi:hypothetical protein
MTSTVELSRMDIASDVIFRLRPWATEYVDVMPTPIYSHIHSLPHTHANGILFPVSCMNTTN